jgi:hypothetical protein
LPMPTTPYSSSLVLHRLSRPMCPRPLTSTSIRKRLQPSPTKSVSSGTPLLQHLLAQPMPIPMEMEMALPPQLSSPESSGTSTATAAASTSPTTPESASEPTSGMATTTTLTANSATRLATWVGTGSGTDILIPGTRKGTIPQLVPPEVVGERNNLC